MQDADDPSFDIANATVWIQSEKGERLAQGRTNELGMAELAAPSEAEAPAYLLVDAEGYFVGGSRWIPGVREYYVLLKVATLR